MTQEELDKVSFAKGPADKGVLGGFGNCLSKPVAAGDFGVVKNAKAAARLYFTTMRTQCLKDQVEAFDDILTEGYTTWNAAEKTFQIPEGIPIL